METVIPAPASWPQGPCPQRRHDDGRVQAELKLTNAFIRAVRTGSPSALVSTPAHAEPVSTLASQFLLAFAHPSQGDVFAGEVVRLCAHGMRSADADVRTLACELVARIASAHGQQHAAAVVGSAA